MTKTTLEKLYKLYVAFVAHIFLFIGIGTIVTVTFISSVTSDYNILSLLITFYIVGVILFLISYLIVHGILFIGGLKHGSK